MYCVVGGAEQNQISKFKTICLCFCEFYGFLVLFCYPVLLYCYRRSWLTFPSGIVDKGSVTCDIRSDWTSEQDAPFGINMRSEIYG